MDAALLGHRVALGRYYRTYTDMFEDE